MNIENLIKAFEEIKQDSSRTGKEALLKKHADLSGFKELLQFIYSPFIVTGLAKKKMAKKVQPKDSAISSLIGIMNYVEFNNTGSDEVIAVVKGYLTKLDSSEEIKFVESILIKDLKVGITSSTINKVFGKNYIPKYDVMLASKYEEHESKVKGDFQISLKLDGIRCTVFNEETGPKFFTRQGHSMEGLIELEKLFEKMPMGFVYDGELIARNADNLSSDDLFRYTQTIVRKDGIKIGLEFFAFDKLPISEFYEGKSKLVLSDRIVSLQNDVAAINEALIKMVPIYYVGKDKDKVFEILDQVTAQGYEGLMVSPTNSYYETKRSRTLLKVKKFETADLIIVGFEEHKHGDKLGSLVVDYKGYEVNVGSGFNDAERNSLWPVRDELIGKIVEVGYFEESSNQAGGISLRFPTFKQIREDKDEPSYN